MAVIDVGSAATNRDTHAASGGWITNIGVDNPANKTGYLTSIEIWVQASMTGAKIATFSRDGDKFTPRDVVTLGAITSGAKRTFTEDASSNPIFLEVETGDYIGIAYYDGAIEISSAGGSGRYTLVGDQTEAGEQTYGGAADQAFSLYGTGSQPPTATTQVATIIVPGGATLNGNITDAIGESITQHGFCWKSGSDPVNIAGADGSSELGAGSEGAFDQAKTGLAEGTKFYYRAYATTGDGTGYGAAQSWTTGQTHSGVVAIAPAVGIESIGNYTCIAACQVGPAVGLAIDGDRVAGGACPVGLAMGVESIANYFCGAECPIGIELDLSLDPNIYILCAMAMTPGAGVSAAANVIRGGVVAIAPGVELLIDGSHLASAVAAITPDANVESKGNYITCAVAAIAIAVSQAALCTRVIDGGSVSISVDASVAATAIRYLLTIIGYSGEFGAGSILEINSDNMTFTIDGVNAIKDIVGSFANVPPGDSTVTYEDDEGTRDVTLDLEYTPRDA